MATEIPGALRLLEIPVDADVSKNVNERRQGALFDKYVLTGKTYTTANGDVIPNELQYYDGEMAHLYGECADVAAVNRALAGSGYKAVALKYADGRRVAAAQLWLSRFTDSSIGPYGAMFIVVIAIRDDVPESEASIAADRNGASSTLLMFDGCFDPVARVYENRARLFLVRLLDTTQVAIDVGRERMGTDKRPGTVEMSRSGRRLSVSIKDEAGRAVVRGDLQLDDNAAAYMPQIARAAATAGIPLREFPSDTEYSYPSVARIGHGPVVSWQWRSDVAPQFQPIAPGSVVFEAGSEEGRMLLAWGFTPKVLGYIRKVRGVVTGLAEPTPVGAIAGLVKPGPPLHAVQSVPIVRAALSRASEAAGRLPVLSFVVDDLLPGRGATPVRPPATETRPGSGAPAAQPRWGWSTNFLGSLTASLRKEVVGVTPEGLRINWHVTSGTFAGPGLDAIVLPGAADWMRIRRDGVAIVNVQACFETRQGVRVFGSYGGIFDLGPDGFARALRDEYDELPPVVVTPTYATADPRLEWLNRAQCVGVGRVDMSALRVEFDVYVVRVGKRISQAASLYDRLGGHDVIVAITDDFVSAVLAHGQLKRFFANAHIQEGLRDRVVDLLCEISGGPCVYKGRDMKTVHRGMGISERDWQIAVELFTAALNTNTIAPRERSEFVQIIEDMKGSIVEIYGRQPE
jgi:truncated hemoglobin YjbI